MITIHSLRQHIITAADRLDLPLTLKQVDNLANHVALHATRGDRPRLRLTTQQHAVLIGLSFGEDCAQTGRRLGVSAHTVKTHRRRLYKALGVHNGAHAVAVAMQSGLLRASDTKGGTA